MIYSSNVFEEFTFCLFTYIRELNSEYRNIDLCCGEFPKEYIRKKKYNANSIIVSLETPNRIGINTLEELYMKCMSAISWLGEDYSLSNLKEFALFLDTAEKAFMYDNSELSELWSVLSGNTYNIYFNTERFKSTIKIEKTKLPNLTSFLQATTDEQYNRLFNSNSVYKTDIEIIRTIGNKSTSNFSYLSNSPLTFTDPLDDILFCTFRNDLSLKIKQIFDTIIEDIIDHNIIYTHIDYLDFDMSHWEGIMQHGLWKKYDE